MAPRSLAATFVDAAARVIRPFVPRNSRLRAWLQVLRMRLPTGHPPSLADRLIQAFAAQYPRAFFIQIGSNDGAKSDPLRRWILTSRWSGILVEPVPYLFAELRKNYRWRRGLLLENVAIAEQNGTRDFYYLRKSDDPSGLPDWYEGLGSFSRELVLSHAFWSPGIEHLLVCEPVRCLTFDSLCNKHGVTHVDLIHIDAEGFDFTIIQSIDFGRLRPRVLMYEHHHLSAADRAACRDLLAGHGYDAFEHELDTVCLNLRDPEARDALLIRLWHQIKTTAHSK